MDPRPKEVIDAAERYKRGEITRAERDRLFSKAAGRSLRENGLRTAGGIERRIVRP